MSDLTHKLDAEIERLKRHLHRIKKAKSGEAGFLHGGEHALMRLVREHSLEDGKKPTSVELCQVLGLSQPTATLLIDRLIKKGYLLKEPSPTDKRAKLLSLTEEGARILTISEQRRYARFSSLLEQLGGEDAAHLVRILATINELFENK